MDASEKGKSVMAAKALTEKAEQRLEQVKQHIGTKSKTRRPKKVRISEGPADWSDVTAELDHIRKLAQTPRTATTGYIRHKEAGKLWVRERVEMLLDPGSFREVGSAAGTVTWIKANPNSETIIEAEKESVGDFTPSNNVQGTVVDTSFIEVTTLTK